MECQLQNIDFAAFPGAVTKKQLSVLSAWSLEFHFYDILDNPRKGGESSKENSQQRIDHKMT
jgi:hypothetical protein